MKIFLRSGRAVLLGGRPGFPPVLHAGDDDGAGGVAGDVDGCAQGQGEGCDVFASAQLFRSAPIRLLSIAIY